jgi:hypothetical protein
MWSAFVTGFATKATELIEERDKEIQDTIKIQLNEMYKSRQSALQTSKTRDEELKKTASQLIGYGLPYSAVQTIIQSGDADNITNLLQKEAVAGTLTPEKINRFIGSKPDDKVTKEILEKTIKQYSTPVKSTSRMPIDLEMRGAFGLPTPEARRTVASTLAPTGMTLEELQATEVPEIPRTQQKFDYSVFKGKEDRLTTVEIQQELRDIIARSETDQEGKLLNFADENDAIRFSELQQLSASNAIAAAIVKVPDEEKPETDTQIRTIFEKALFNGLNPFVISGVAQVLANGEVTPITGDAEDISSFLATRNNIVRSVAVNRGFLDPRTNKVSSRAAENALTSYAVIEDGKLVSWKTAPPGGKAGSQQAKPAAAAPKVATPPAGALPLPRDENGLIITSKLKKGQDYVSSKGNVQKWNGKTFE